MDSDIKLHVSVRIAPNLTLIITTNTIFKLIISKYHRNSDYLDTDISIPNVLFSKRRIIQNIVVGFFYNFGFRYKIFRSYKNQKHSGTKS